jgi:predicted DNA-binding ribbon-helix-helix protein
MNQRRAFSLKRSFSIAGHRTSVALEPEFWNVLEMMAESGHETVPKLIGRVDAARPKDQPLSSALRVAALSYAARRSLGN